VDPTAIEEPTEPTAIPMVSAETGENEPKRSTTPNNNVVIQNVLVTTRFA
jgi:hypothetical protein